MLPAQTDVHTYCNKDFTSMKSEVNGIMSKDVLYSTKLYSIYICPVHLYKIGHL